MASDILHKVPNPPFPVEIMDRAPVEVANPFSGEKVMLEPIAVAVYDCIKGAEMMAGLVLVVFNWVSAKKTLSD